MNIIFQHKKQMIKNNNEQIADSKETYNFQMMLNDIQESSLRGKQDTLAADKAEREQQSKLIVLQMLVDKADKYLNNRHRDDESLRNANASFEDYNNVMFFLKALEGGENG